VKLIAVLLVRNEADIIEATVRHHLRAGVDEVLALDNGSTDGTSSVLERLAARHPVRWSVDPGPYRQSELTTGLAEEARARGATWVLPVDADEFWWSRRSLPAVLGVLPRDVAAVSAPVVNFVQRRSQRRRTSRAVARMTLRVDRAVAPEAGPASVASGAVPFVAVAYAPKWISRASPGLVIHAGNHAVSGADGHLVASDEISVLHAPLRSAAVLEDKARLGDRIREAGFGDGEAWQIRRWSSMERPDLRREWAANSSRRGRLGASGRRDCPLVRDLRLQRAVQEAWGR
jgi:glycosyltransferase involved in cell wall biosynthesis